MTNLSLLSLTGRSLNKDMPLVAFHSTCSECGEYVSYLFNGETLKDGVMNHETMELERKKCSLIGDYTFEVNFPTGKVICADRLPNSYDMLQRLDDNCTHTLNSSLGLKERTLSYATENILHVFVGNTCPSVFKKDDTLVIGHSSNNECGNCSCGREECNCEYEEYPPIDGAENIANICTDLWWASVVDVSIYEKLLADYFGKEEAEKYMDKIEAVETKLKPGVYKCTYHRVEDTYDRPTVYATFKWDREA